MRTSVIHKIQEFTGALMDGTISDRYLKKVTAIQNNSERQSECRVTARETTNIRWLMHLEEDVSIGAL